MNADTAIALARVALRFGQVERATAHPDGTPESDTTHTVMLALLVAEIADRMRGVDTGLAVMFAMVHDLPEAYAGDTCTARGLSAQQAAAKADREREATRQLGYDLGGWSLTMALLHRYEQQFEFEARLVRYVDKITPKLTHILNRGHALRSIGMTFDEMVQKHTQQGSELQKLYREFPEVDALFDEICKMAESELRGRI